MNEFKTTPEQKLAFKKTVEEVKADKDTKWIMLLIAVVTFLLFGFMIKYGFQ